jgi:DNA invertase Pin-like site-specific DNA recombinase
MDYIYARVSTDHQTTDNQVVQLSSQYPSATVVAEVASGAKERPALRQLVSDLTAGDRLIVYAIDRLGRSAVDTITLIEALFRKGVVVVSSREGILDPSTPMGAFFLNVMSAFAQMERDILRERVRAGLERAKRDGKKLGRAYTYPDEMRARIRDLRASGASLLDIAKQTGVSKSQAHEILKQIGDLT